MVRLVVWQGFGPKGKCTLGILCKHSAEDHQFQRMLWSIRDLNIDGGVLTPRAVPNLSKILILTLGVRRGRVCLPTVLWYDMPDSVDLKSKWAQMRLWFQGDSRNMCMCLLEFGTVSGHGYKLPGDGAWTPWDFLRGQCPNHAANQCPALLPVSTIIVVFWSGLQSDYMLDSV